MGHMKEQEIMIQKIKPEITECRILQIEKTEEEIYEEIEECCTNQ